MPMKLSRDIESFTRFKRESPRFLKQLEETKEPIVLTVNGKARLVVQDAEAYEELMRIKDRVEMVAAVKKGLESMRKGEGRDADEFFAELEAKYAITEEE